MNIIHWLIASRLWVAFAAAAWSVESFERCGVWIRWTLVAQIFFLTWIAYLFLTDHGIRKHRAAALVALTGACVTFQGIETMVIPALCAILVLLYRSHWLPESLRKFALELRNIPLFNNMVIGACWIVLCVLWPMQQAGIEFQSQLPNLVASFMWITALSMSEDLFVETTPDATLRWLGKKTLRVVAVLLVCAAMGVSAVFSESSVSVWLSMIASLLLLLFMPGGKRTATKSWLIDAMIVLRFPF
jgi:hypothetical protein